MTAPGPADPPEVEYRAGAIIARLRDAAAGVRRAVSDDHMPDAPAMRPPLDQPEHVHDGFVLSRADIYEAIGAAQVIERIVRRRWVRASDDARTVEP